MKKTIIIIFIILALAPPAFAGNSDWCSWDKENTKLLIPISILYFIDYRQASYAIKHPDEYYELNPALGKYPSQGDLDKYAVLSYGLTTAIAFVLKSEYSHPFQIGVASVKFMAVGNNFYVGIGFGI